jgi:hypothetical protein
MGVAGLVGGLAGFYVLTFIFCRLVVNGGQNVERLGWASGFPSAPSSACLARASQPVEATPDNECSDEPASVLTCQRSFDMSPVVGIGRGRLRSERASSVAGLL